MENLHLLNNKTITKDNQDFIIESVEPDEEAFLVTTSEGAKFKISAENVKDLMSEFQQMELVQNAVVISATKTMDNVSSLNKVLMDTIEKINNDASFIPQAEAINQTAMTMLEVAKTQIEAVKLMKS